MISIKNPIVDAMDLCGIDNGNSIPLFTRWAILAEKAIRSKYQFTRKIAVLDISHCTACLPDDAAILQLAILGEMDCSCGDLFQRYCSTINLSSSTLNASADSTSFLIVDIGQGETYMYNYVSHEVQDNKIVFAHDYDGQKVTIQYLAYNMDCEGFLQISENHVEAITYCICWKYYMSKKRKSNDDFAMVNKYEALWQRHCANARALDGEMTESQRQEAVAMIHNPYAGYSLSVGMRTTLGNYSW